MDFANQDDEIAYFSHAEMPNSFGSAVPPPMMEMAISSADESIFSSSVSSVDLLVSRQPPNEVRTRTPGDKRTFSCSVSLQGKWSSLGLSSVQVELYYAPDRLHPNYEKCAKQSLLGGQSVCAVAPSDNEIQFTMWLWEPSTKHKEREFCLRFIPQSSSGEQLLPDRRFMSNAFYAFSHQRVLQRRRRVVLRCLNKQFASSNGGDQMHVIGKGFMNAPTLTLIVRTAHGETRANHVEYWSDSVLFFTLPPLPLAAQLDANAQPQDTKAMLFVSNDGRSLSNPMEFTYSDVEAQSQMFRARF